MRKLLATLLMILVASQVWALDPGIYITGKHLAYQQQTVLIAAYMGVVTRFEYDGKIIEVRPKSFGAGAIITSKGHILTAAHIVTYSDRITVCFWGSNKEYDVTVLKIDEKKDLALLKVNANNELSYFQYQPVVFIGDAVTVIGHPLLIMWSVTKGHVSGVTNSFMTIDAAVNPGNSGGPVINNDGELVGIVSALISPIPAFTGIGVIIAGNNISSFLQDFVGLEEFWK